MIDNSQIAYPFDKIKSLEDTPAYIYFESVLDQLWSAYSSAVDDIKDEVGIHFAMKANSNPEVLKFFHKKDAGIDSVSIGEVNWALKNGFKPNQIVFSGVGKTRPELEKAIELDVMLINIESPDELDDIFEIATKLNKKVNIGVRFNPGIDAKTHPYIATGLSDHKFGVESRDARAMYESMAKFKLLGKVGISFHIGSQLQEVNALWQAAQVTFQFAKNVKKDFGINFDYFDVGGGLGIDYAKPEKFPNFNSYGEFLKKVIKLVKSEFGDSIRVASENGRSLCAQAGVIQSSVIRKKMGSEKKFLIVDASMTEIIRPSLYQAEHAIYSKLEKTTEKILYEVVGPVCESTDVIRSRVLLSEQSKHDKLFIMCAGAYCQVLASSYNMRSIAPEYWVRLDGEIVESRKRVEAEDIWR